MKVVKLSQAHREASDASMQEMVELEIALTTTREGREIKVVAARARATTQQVNGLVCGHSEDPGGAHRNPNP